LPVSAGAGILGFKAAGKLGVPYIGAAIGKGSGIANKVMKMSTDSGAC